jgi:V8-like Glu-specific endopeptidase
MKQLIKVSLLFAFLLPQVCKASGLEYCRDFGRLYLSVAIMITSSPDSSVATGFLTESPLVPNKVVLTTAKHVVENAREIELQVPFVDTNNVIIETRKFSVPLYKDSVRLFYTPERHLDLALIFIDKQKLQTAHDVIRYSSFTYSGYTEMKHLVVGQSVLFAGYPLGLTINQTNPLLRKGIIAGIDTLKDIIYLDADAFGGSSGSPVFINYDSPIHFEFLQSTKQILVGVISAYIPFQKRFRNLETGRIEMVQTENSGIAEVVPAEKIRAFADSLIGLQK